MADYKNMRDTIAEARAKELAELLKKQYSQKYDAGQQANQVAMTSELSGINPLREQAKQDRYSGVNQTGGLYEQQKRELATVAAERGDFSGGLSGDTAARLAAAMQRRVGGIDKAYTQRQGELDQTTAQIRAKYEAALLQQEQARQDALAQAEVDAYLQGREIANQDVSLIMQQDSIAMDNAERQRQAERQAEQDKYIAEDRKLAYNDYMYNKYTQPTIDSAKQKKASDAENAKAANDAFMKAYTLVPQALDFRNQAPSVSEIEDIMRVDAQIRNMLIPYGAYGVEKIQGSNRNNLSKSNARYNTEL